MAKSMSVNVRNEAKAPLQKHPYMMHNELDVKSMLQGPNFRNSAVEYPLKYKIY